MDLEEAISHLKELIDNHDFDCVKCKRDHEALLGFLEELKQRRDKDGRLIDGDWVLDHLKPYEPSDEEWSVTGGTALRLIHNAVDNAPTVDAVVVRHGRWEYIPQTLNTLSQLRCSFCGWWSIDPSIDGAYNYCPNCGCRMDGKP